MEGWTNREDTMLGAGHYAVPTPAQDSEKYHKGLLWKFGGLEVWKFGRTAQRLTAKTQVLGAGHYAVPTSAQDSEEYHKGVLWKFGGLEVWTNRTATHREDAMLGAGHYAVPTPAQDSENHHKG